MEGRVIPQEAKEPGAARVPTENGRPSAKESFSEDRMLCEGGCQQ